MNLSEVLAEVKAAGSRLPVSRATIISAGPGSKARIEIGELSVRGFDEFKLVETEGADLDLRIGDAFIKARETRDLPALNAILEKALSAPEPDLGACRRVLDVILRIAPAALDLYTKARSYLGL